MKATLLSRRTWVLLALLVVALLALGGCGVPQTGVDVTTTDPEGLWQTIFVWPVAKALIWLADTLQSYGVPWYWGFAIIIFTIFIKILTLPLTITQMRGMAAQRAIQPRVQELQKKYGNDRNKLAQEQMKLYQEAGVNPLSGCLPLLIQMPILFALYAAMVVNSQYLEGQGFFWFPAINFWIPNLNFPNAQVGMSWVLDDLRNMQIVHMVAYLILPILLMVTQFVMQKWMSPAINTSDPQMKTTQQVTLIMTFMFGFFTLQVPAGLTLYWVTSNLLQMLQQWYMMRNASAAALAPAAAAVVDSTATAAPAKTSTKTLSKATTVKPSTTKSGSAVKRKGTK